MSIESRSRQYGKVFDHWQIREFLGSGSGGKSAVFRLEHANRSSVKSALKVISLIENRGEFESLSGTRKAEYEATKQKCMDYAEQEVLLMNSLQGRTNVVDYLDHTFVDWVDEGAFGCDMLIRMELLRDLRSQIEEEHQFSQTEVLKIGRDICSALVLCHRKEILHRDIKPENIFYNEDGNYKLGDFGVSRILSAAPMSKASTGVCTPEYAAPEQLSGQYDTRVDIYSLGLVLYELSNGNRLPFSSSSYISENEVRERLNGKPLPAPRNASKSFAAAILKACAFRPEDRYQTAEDFLAELNYLAGVGPCPVVTTSPVGRDAQKAATAIIGNATQYAGADTGKWKNSRETVYANPGERKVPVYQTAEGSKKWLTKGVIVGIAAVLALIMIFLLRGKHEHAWINATCTAPRTCEECGETEGNSLGHTWSDATCTAPRTCEECGETEGNALGHTWSDATCTDPRTCEECGETEGNSLGHTWSDATCTSSSICLTCGAANGTAPGHQWLAATYQDPQTCSVCGLTEGESLSNPWKLPPLETPTGIISVSPGGWSTYALTDGGRLYAIGRNQDGQTDVSLWSDIVDVAAGDRHVAVLHETGTVDAIGRWEHGQCDVNSWRNIIRVYAGVYCTVGICEDGTVKLAGQSPEVTFDVSDWTDIVQVDVSDHFIVGLRVDGTVVYTGGNGHEGDDNYHENYYKYDRNGNKEEIEAWENIVEIAAGDYHTLGLRSDGTVVATTPKEGEYPDACDVSDWEDIIAISAGQSFSVGLRRDGTVVVAGDFTDKDIISRWKGNIHTAESWTDIIQISAYYNQIIGLTKDGNIVACGFNSYGQCETEDLNRKILDSLQ